MTHRTHNEFVIQTSEKISDVQINHPVHAPAALSCHRYRIECGAGDPTENRVIVNQLSVSWVGEPINKWVMLDGGDLPDYLLIDPDAPRNASRGPVLIRFADHPWGPFSTPEPHLQPGSPAVVGDPYGPGGVLYHYDCEDAGSIECAQSDPTRPLHLVTFCIMPAVETDIGRFYGVNIIDAYTELGSDHAHLYWNVSTWNPYAVVLVKTTLLSSSSPLCGDGTCEVGEDCHGCPDDCPVGQGAVCGNGICEAGNGEDCVSCPADCDGYQQGKPSGRYCCGDGDGVNPIACGEAGCESNCTNVPAAPSCCGDLVCEGSESNVDCEVDCGPAPVCGDGNCDAGETSCECPEDCGEPDPETCDDGIDNDCDDAIDCADTDCEAHPLCACSGVGESCIDDADCCSNKCRGKAGNKTCR
jgi:hypothetical protein